MNTSNIKNYKPKGFAEFALQLAGVITLTTNIFNSKV